jgi:CheY-like chemotaxis protein
VINPTESTSTEEVNILVIEDDDALRAMLAEFLSKHQHQVVVAESAEEGLQMLPQWTFQIAFVDHNLPGMNGLVLGEYLRRNNPDMSIVMMTGSEEVGLERRSRDLSLQFMPKPFRLADVLRVVDEFVTCAREREERRRTHAEPLYDPPIESYVTELSQCYGVPKVPARIEERLVTTVKRCLSNLRTASRYTERDRVVAFSGLLTAEVLGVSLPNTKAGLTLFQEYDRLMVERGRRTEFSTAS